VGNETGFRLSELLNKPKMNWCPDRLAGNLIPPQEAGHRAISFV
jgi:hypothetical protein